MNRLTAFAAVALLVGCGPRPQPEPDAGEEDAGFDAGVVDAGRPRGDDPLTGWTTVVEQPIDAGSLSRVGVSAASAPDQWGHPLVAALFEDPNGDGVRLDTRVVFTRWNGTARAFDAPKTVEIVGALDIAAPHRQVSVARDPDSGRISLAYVKAETNAVRYAWSDDEGANFSLTNASDLTAALVSDPSLALKGGVVHLAYVKGSALVYRTRTGNGAWTEQTPGAGSNALSGPVSLALDSAGQPAVAFFQAQAGGAAELVFWRPGGAAPVVIASSSGLDVSPIERQPSVSLVFQGLVPHVAYHLRQVAPLPANDDTTELFYAAAVDAAAASWKTPVAIPRNRDGAGVSHSTRHFQALALDANGRVSIAANWALGGSATQCAGPKLARSANGLTFDTCSPVTSPVQRGAEWLSMWPYKPAKQSIVFGYDSRANPQLKGGVVMWREP